MKPCEARAWWGVCLTRHTRHTTLGKKILLSLTFVKYLGYQGALNLCQMSVNRERKRKRKSPDSSTTPLPDTPHTGKHLRWETWERDAEILRQRYAKNFDTVALSKRKRFPTWDEIVEKAEAIRAAAEGKNADVFYGLFNKHTFTDADTRTLKGGPLIFKHQEKLLGQCWLAPIECKCSHTQFSGCHVSAREVMWISKDPANWYIMRMIKANFNMQSNACSGRKALLKLEISHLCHNPNCLNPSHLNLEQHGGWYSRKPIHPEDVQPGFVAKLPRWVGDGVDFPKKQGTQMQTDESPFLGKIEVTPNGGQRVYRFKPDFKPNAGVDVTVGCGSKSGNVDRTCRDFPVWIDRHGFAAAPPCPHTPECVFTLRRSRLLVVDQLNRECMQTLSCVMSEATDEAMDMARVGTDDPDLARRIMFE